MSHSGDMRVKTEQNFQPYDHFAQSFWYYIQPFDLQNWLLFVNTVLHFLKVKLVAQEIIINKKKHDFYNLNWNNIHETKLLQAYGIYVGNALNNTPEMDSNPRVAAA